MKEKIPALLSLKRLVCFQTTMTFTSFSRHHMFAVLNFRFVLNRENLVHRIANAHAVLEVNYFDVYRNRTCKNSYPGLFFTIPKQR